MEKKYMETLLAQIREKHAKERIRLEIKSHIEDQKAEYMTHGLTENEAEEKAVADMGDPIETGTALDLIHKPRPAWGMLAVIAILCASGVILQYAIGLNTHGQSYRESYLFQNQCFHALLGFFVLCIVYLIDYTWIAKYSRWLCAGILLFLFITLLSDGGDLGNSAHRTIHLFHMHLSPEPILYLYIPAYGAVLHSYRSCRKQTLGKALLYLILPICLALWIGHGSLFLNLSLILIIMFLTATTKGWFSHYTNSSASHGSHAAGAFTWRNPKIRMLSICCTGLLSVFVLIFRKVSQSMYQTDRIKAWLNPQFDPFGAGYINNIVRKIINSSQLIGESKSLSIPDHLPNTGTDYMLTSTIGYFGILCASALILLMILFGIKLLHLAIHQANQLGMIMGLGCSLLFFMQSVEYILVNLGFLPSAGLYFPLISYGGCGMLQTCIFLGILLSIYRYQDVVTEPDIKSFRKAA